MFATVADASLLSSSGGLPPAIFAICVDSAASGYWYNMRSDIPCTPSRSRVPASSLLCAPSTKLRYVKMNLPTLSNCANAGRSPIRERITDSSIILARAGRTAFQVPSDHASTLLPCRVMSALSLSHTWALIPYFSRAARALTLPLAAIWIRSTTRPATICDWWLWMYFIALMYGTNCPACCSRKCPVSPGLMAKLSSNLCTNGRSRISWLPMRARMS